MNYEGNIIRPPSEANSIILQVTTGCSHNRCTFCGAYKGVRFRIKDAAIVDADIDFAARCCRNLKRVFLADGDALVIPTPLLVAIFASIRRNLPWVKRVSLYGNARSILAKTPQELLHFKELGLDRIYMGLESGHAEILKKIRKGVTPEQMIKAADRVRSAGLFLSVTVLLGIGGRAASSEHARETGRVLTQMGPNQIAALTLMLLDNTELYRDAERGVFQLPDRDELLRELGLLVEAISLERVQFQANHASNYLPVSGRLSRDRERILQLIDAGLRGDHQLKADYLRSL